MADKYDGITIGTLATEKWLEERGVMNNSRSIGELYDVKLRTDLQFDSQDVLNMPDDDINSKVYEMVQPIGSTNGALDVAIQDQTTEIIDLHLSQEVQVITLTVNTNVNDTTITFNASQIPVIGNNICLKEGTAFYQGAILSVVDNTGGNYTVTLDTPLDYAFTIAGGCSERTENLAVNGSVTPQIFSVSPKGLQAGTKWDITRMLITITDDGAMDDGKFGGITALTNGIVFRKVNGTTKNIFNAKTNGDLAAHMYDVTYADKAPAGLNGLRARRSFAGQDKNGVTIRLNADDNDTFEVIIQDNLTGLTNFQVIAQGHVVE